MSESPVDLVSSAKSEFIRKGGNPLHKPVAERLDQATNNARAEYERQNKPTNPQATQAIQKFLGWLAVIFTFTVLLVGSLLVLVLVPMAEAVSVAKGIGLFEDHPLMVWLPVVALFIGLYVLMFYGHVYTDNLTTSHPYDTFVQAWWRFKRRWGLKHGEIVEHTTIEKQYLGNSKSLSAVKSFIVWGSVVGRLGVLIMTYSDVPFILALWNVVQNITLLEVVSMVVTFKLISALLGVMDTVVLQVYVSYRSVAGRLDLGNAGARSGQSLEALIAQYQAEVYQTLTEVLDAKNQNQPAQPQ